VISRPPAIAVTIETERGAAAEQAAYEHPLVVRYCHWLSAISLLVLIFSGWQIYWAFPSFGPKIPQHDFVHLPRLLMLGGWLGGALQWHLTFIWIFVPTGLVYLAYEFASGNYRQALFTPGDVAGVWPMVRYYFLFGPKPVQSEPYNPLQKLAYTSVIALGMLAVLTGLAVYNPVQFSFLAKLMGGFHLARLWHFAVMAGLLFFIVGHLIMVVLHGWRNFASMLTGWKRDPEYPV